MPSTALVTNSSIKRMYFDGNYYIYLGVGEDGNPIFGREDRKSLEYLISKNPNRYYGSDAKYTLFQPKYTNIEISSKESKEQEKEQEKE